MNTQKNEIIAGIDLGGTKILTVIAGTYCNLLAQADMLTHSEQGYEGVISRIIESIDAALGHVNEQRASLKLLAICTPGPEIDTKKGIVHFSNNLQWRDVYLKEILEEKLKIPVVVENDANAAALGECLFGAGRSLSNMVYVTVSTGIGCGIIMDRKIYHGVSDSAGELGHTIIYPDGPRCSCGNNGCLEAVASGAAIAREAKRLAHDGQADVILAAANNELEDIDAGIVAAAAMSGDNTAMEIFDNAGKALGIGLANLVNLINPSVVVLGGGVMKSKDLIWTSMKREFERRVIKRSGQHVKIVSAELGSMSGAMGMIAIANTELKGDICG